jgi:hypothetical protein
MGVVYEARSVSPSRVASLRMMLAGGLTSARDIRRVRTETEAEAHLDYFSRHHSALASRAGCLPLLTGGEPNSDDFLHLGAARVGRIDRSIGEPSCARRCRRTDARKTTV